MSTYLSEVKDAEHEGVEKTKFRDTQLAMAEQVIEIAKVLQDADVEDEREPIGAYMEAAALIVSTQATGLALRRIQYGLSDLRTTLEARRS